MFQERTAAFIVRLWIEPRELQAEPIWRGFVEHVATGERRYVSGLDEVDAFISTYLAQMEADTPGPKRGRRQRRFGRIERKKGDSWRFWSRHPRS